MSIDDKSPNDIKAFLKDTGTTIDDVYMFVNSNVLSIKDDAGASDDDDCMPYNEEFFLTHRLLTNPFVQDAPIDGFMFETYGEEYEFVNWINSVYPENVFTIIEEDDRWYICEGKRFVNRIGYFIVLPEGL